MPVHVHGDEEEIFFVLAGAGLSWQDGRDLSASAPGDCIVHRVGAEAAHDPRPADGGSTCSPSARARTPG